MKKDYGAAFLTVNAMNKDSLIKNAINKDYDSAFLMIMPW